MFNNKNSNFTVNRDYGYKKYKQGWSPTPADILVGIKSHISYTCLFAFL